MKKITDLWKWGKEKFLSKQFITFVVIGFINTIIDYIVCWVFRVPLNVHIALAGAIAFVVASIFSYFANSTFTFENKDYNAKNLTLSMIVFASRLGVVTLLTILFVFIFDSVNCVIGDVETTELISHLIASILTIPISYLFLEPILKVKKPVQGEEI